MNERETFIATTSFAAGWDAALDEARKAVAKWFTENRNEMAWPEFLDIFDALKEKP